MFVTRRGFTLIELMVVISIIGLLASVMMSSFSEARASARDTVRRTQLKQVQLAMEAYYSKHGTYQVANSGWMNAGQGWFSYEGGAYTRSVARALYEEGLIVLPRAEDPLQSPGYMIYLCDGGRAYSVSATLENPTPDDEAYIQTTCNGVGANGTFTRYGKNYAVAMK